MSYGQTNVDIIQSSAAGVPPQFNDGNGAQVGTLCRAWVQFAGATGAVAASFNVSSITRSGTGNFIINFAKAMPDSNYSTVGSCGSGASSNGIFVSNYSSAPTTTNCSISTSSTSVLTDYAYTSVAIFR